MQKSYTIANLFLFALIILVGLTFGPEIFEYFTTDRLWAADPLKLAKFMDQYGRVSGPYWQIVPTITVIWFILTLIFNWKIKERRKLLSYALILFVTMVASSLLYFAPEQNNLVAEARTFSTDVLKERTDLWMMWNYLRMGAAILSFVFLLKALRE